MFSRREFTLEDDGIEVLLKEFASSNKYHVNYENIPPRPQEFTKASKRLLGLAVIFTALIVICMVVQSSTHDSGGWEAVAFWAVFAAIAWCAYFMSRKSTVLYAQNGGGLALFKDSPSAHDIEVFVKKLFVARNKCLLRKYGAFSEVESLETKLNRLTFLRNQGVITDAEFARKREEFMTGGRKTTGPPGFAQS